MVKHEYEQGDDGDGSVNEARLNEKVPSRKALINYGIKQKVGQPKFTWLDHKGTTFIYFNFYYTEVHMTNTQQTLKQYQS